MNEPLQRMTHWLEHAVIGLNLCPFAKAVHVKGQIHWVVSDAQDDAQVLSILQRELQDLHALSADVRDTTLIVLPHAFADFYDFNDFLGRAERVLKKLKLEGVFQIASFHPQFVFAGTDEDDITNATNRAPYPTLHLLREASVDRAVQAFPQAEDIFENNMRTLVQLGVQGWHALMTLPVQLPPKA
jgi:hypothetical protein